MARHGVLKASFGFLFQRKLGDGYLEGHNQDKEGGNSNKGGIVDYYHALSGNTAKKDMKGSFALRWERDGDDDDERRRQCEL